MGLVSCVWYCNDRKQINALERMMIGKIRAKKCGYFSYTSIRSNYQLVKIEPRPAIVSQKVVT